MSYSIRIVDRNTGDTFHLSERHEIHGGTYCVGGTTECGMDITYNYSKWFDQLWPKHKDHPEEDGIRSLYGKSIKDVIDDLSIAVDTLKGLPDADYWKATEGNARKALFDLKTLCELADYENDQGKELILTGD